jgi:hypothetical protein
MSQKVPRALVAISAVILFAGVGSEVALSQTDQGGDAVGPRMTDVEFFGALDLELPALAEVRARFEASDLEGAKEAYATYLLQRESPRYFADWREMPAPENRPPNPNTRAADKVLAGEYTSCGVPITFTDRIDWQANPAKPFNPEWTWQLGRFAWWGDLARAYWDTGDERYAAQFVRELRSWVGDNPMPEKVANAVGSRWRTIECGIRLAGPWPNAFFRFLGSPSFTPDDVVLMVKSMVEQADYLQRYPTGGNWLTMESNGMGHVGVLFPEFRRAQVWRDDGIARQYKELDNQFYPDGPQKELATGYHYVALGNILGLARICLRNDVPLPPDYVAKLEGLWEVGMWVMMPDRTTPEVNDGSRVNVPGTLKEALAFFPKRDDFRYLATDGSEGSPPTELSHWFPWAGWAVMRTGWGRDDNYLFFDGGPFGMGHQHEDKLAFQIYAYGSYLLIDPGNYMYDQSAMRAYVLGAAAHNIVSVDGKAQHRRGLRATSANTSPETSRWESTPAYDYCEGVYADGFGGDNALKVTQKRAVLFVKPGYWLVLDTLTPADADPHQYEALFHLGTDQAVAEGPSVRTVSDAANLSITAIGAEVAADVVRGQETPSYLGWRSRGILDRVPCPVGRFRWDAAGVSRVLWVCYPTRPGESAPAVAPLPNLPAGTLGATIETPGGADTVRLTPNPDGTVLWEVDRHGADGIRVVL